MGYPPLPLRNEIKEVTLDSRSTLPRADYKHCKACGRHSAECGPLSNTRLCGDCAYVILSENITGLAEHKGPALDRWRRGMVACAGGVLLDDTPQGV
jgi:hypothetical protein